jgi:hypothetical protein
MHDVLASLKEAIESDKQSVCCDFPLVLRLSLVVKVSIFEFVADINSKTKVIICFFGVGSTRFNESKYLRPIHLLIALGDDGIANLSD